MVIIIQIALKFDGQSYIEFVVGGLKDSLDIPYANILNGYFVCFVILNLLLIHIPLLIALVAGDSIAGEANMGTLRLIASKPVSRTGLMLSKFIATSYLYRFIVGLAGFYFTTAECIVFWDQRYPDRKK